MTTQTMSLDEGRIARFLDPEIAGLLVLLVFVCVVFGTTANGFVSRFLPFVLSKTKK